jgi:hypothetical protein
MLRLRGFRLTIYCDPCKEAFFINLVERPDLEDVPVGSVDFQCQQCRQLGHYRLIPPFRGEKPRLFEQAAPAAARRTTIRRRSSAPSRC